MMPFLRIFFLVILSVTVLPTTLSASACNESCNDYTDCPDDQTCPICVGSCTSCRTLGSSTACADAAVGASTRCTWNGVDCVYLTELSETPASLKLFLLFFAGLFTVWLGRRVQISPSAFK